LRPRCAARSNHIIAPNCPAFPSGEIGKKTPKLLVLARPIRYYSSSHRRHCRSLRYPFAWFLRSGCSALRQHRLSNPPNELNQRPGDWLATPHYGPRQFFGLKEHY
jgi:hypothetical protein